MATISKVPVALTGFLGGPGVNTFYILGEVDDLQPLRDFYGSFVSELPNDVTVSFPTTGVTVDSVTGGLTGSWSAPSETDVTGTDTAKFAAGVGTVIRWITATVLDGRILRGRTFIVPLAGDCFENNGLLTLSRQAIFQGAADTLVTAFAGALLVWHRPVDGLAGAGIPALGAYVPRKPAVLRSRRD